MKEHLQGEDVIGGLMKQGTFHFTGVLELANKIEKGCKDYHKMLTENTNEQKLRNRIVSSKKMP